MLHILLFSGGTGSISLQEGLYALYHPESFRLDIVVNAFDNGQSTGLCRRAMGGKILGPSDIRKNHLTQLRLARHGEWNDSQSRTNALWRLFDTRLRARDKQDCLEQALAAISSCRESIGETDAARLQELTEAFFFEVPEKHVWRASLDGEDFGDFALANAFYAVLAARNGGYMRPAAREMAAFLGIPDNVHLISDINLYLRAVTQHGVAIPDEGDIVRWDHPEDPIERVTLYREGQPYLPALDEGIDRTEVPGVRDLIRQADLILFSCGTQWSSLIPTYMHQGLREELKQAKARQYLILNNEEDRDMRGVPADRLIREACRYLPQERLTALVNLDACETLREQHVLSQICGHFGNKGNRHDPKALVRALMEDYYGLRGFHGHFVFDLDGTLWDDAADEKGKRVGRDNLKRFTGIILSGNSEAHIRRVFRQEAPDRPETDLYSDFGNVHFTSRWDGRETLTDGYSVPGEIVSALKLVPAFAGKVHVRGEGCVVTVKPLTDREKLLPLAEKCLQEGPYTAIINGRTSIDITHRDYNKKTMLRLILIKKGWKPEDTVFVGNETRTGTETEIPQLGVRTIQADDIFACNMLLRTWELQACAEENHTK